MIIDLIHSNLKRHGLQKEMTSGLQHFYIRFA